MKNYLRSFLAAALCSFAALASASTYTESLDGDLSGDRLNPTAFAVEIGENHLTATSTAGDLEYFRLVMPANTRLVRIDHQLFQSDNTRAFFGVQEGTTFSVTPDQATPSDLLGYVHFGIETLGSNMLPAMGSAGGAQGFTSPLEFGDYTFWAQQLEPIPALYEFSFVVAAVPEPSTFALAVVAASALLGLSRRRRRAEA